MRSLHAWPVLADALLEIHGARRQLFLTGRAEAALGQGSVPQMLRTEDRLRDVGYELAKKALAQREREATPEGRHRGEGQQRS